ncbi:MAG TPA: substrate-binding domain-containing protein [Stellaceae bacterium]|jgi:molybdate transport system substrate-binding protein|nr:substrate-binding domain-containing protein [Stellaceae bacterium]
MFRIALSLSLLIAMTQAALASELTVIGQATTIGALKQLVPRFEKQSGDKVEIALGNPGVTLDRLRQAPSVDVLIVGTNLWNTALKEGWIDETSRITLGQTHIGIGISRQAKPPIIRDKASFIAFLRQVKTIGLVDPNGGSGTSPPFMKAVEALGIAGEIAPKYRYIPGAGDAVSDAIARGDVESGVTAIPELAANRGVKVIGPVPADVLDWSATTYAVVGSHAQNPAAARQFVAFLQSSAAIKAFRAIGLNPAN